MTSFLTDLWESIFTPGPTPTLLIATNAAFGALQLLLLTLLLTTYSIHFFILSTICGGLWWAINWFATELQAAKAQEAADAAKAGNRQTSPDPTGSDTETETDSKPPITTGASTGHTEPSLQKRKHAQPPRASPGQSSMPPPTAPAAAAAAPPPQQTSAPLLSSATIVSTTGSASHLQPKAPAPATGTGDSQNLGGRRRRSLGDSSGYVSTDSEWEKVSEGEAK